MDLFQPLEPNRRPAALAEDAAASENGIPPSGMHDLMEGDVQPSLEQVGPPPEARRSGEGGSARAFRHGSAGRPIAAPATAGANVAPSTALANTDNMPMDEGTFIGSRPQAQAEKKDASPRVDDEFGSLVPEPAQASGGMAHGDSGVDASSCASSVPGHVGEDERKPGTAMHAAHGFVDTGSRHPVPARTVGRRSGANHCDEIGGRPLHPDEENAFDTRHCPIDDGEDRAHHLAMSPAVPVPALLPPNMASSGALTALGKPKLRTESGRRPGGRSAGRFEIPENGKGSK